MLIQYSSPPPSLRCVEALLFAGSFWSLACFLRAQLVPGTTALLGMDPKGLPGSTGYFSPPTRAEFFLGKNIRGGKAFAISLETPCKIYVLKKETQRNLCLGKKYSGGGKYPVFPGRRHMPWLEQESISSLTN